MLKSGNNFLNIGNQKFVFIFRNEILIFAGGRNIVVFRIKTKWRES